LRLHLLAVDVGAAGAGVVQDGGAVGADLDLEVDARDGGGGEFGGGRGAGGDLDGVAGVDRVGAAAVRAGQEGELRSHDDLGSRGSGVSTSVSGPARGVNDRDRLTAGAKLTRRRWGWEVLQDLQ